jgi:hypothetical protein
VNAIQHSNGQDNINVNEISKSLTSATLNGFGFDFRTGNQDTENSPAPLSGFAWKNT